MREVAAEFERPVLLFSGGKDSIVLLRLAEKAFRPARFPFPLMHVDTGDNFPEVIEFRDRRVVELGERLLVASVQDSIDHGRVVEERGPRASRNRLQTTTLLDAIADAPLRLRQSAAPAATKSAPAPRSGSSPFATTSASGTPNRSAPNSGTSTTGASAPASTSASSRSRTGPSSTSGNTSPRKQLEVPSIYFAHERPVFSRDGMLYAWREGTELIEGEQVETATVRYRTVGDMTLHGRRAVRRDDARRGRHRDRRHPRDRTRRDTRGRPGL